VASEDHIGETIEVKLRGGAECSDHLMGGPRSTSVGIGADYLAMARRSAWYVDQITKGIPPGNLPAELATDIRLIVNLKTGKELAITIPPSLLARADEVIE
jgi:putative ABC transport system substrate-binding protein